MGGKNVFFFWLPYETRNKYTVQAIYQISFRRFKQLVWRQSLYVTVLHKVQGAAYILNYNIQQISHKTAVHPKGSRGGFAALPNGNF